MVTHKCRTTLREARQQLEEVQTLLEEDLHNITLQEDTSRLEMVVRKEEEYIARGARVCARL